MINLLRQPAFIAYAVTTLLLCINLMFLWLYSGATRARTKTAINPEDAKQFGGVLAQNDPPAVARVLRAHRNAEASIIPFLLLGLVFVLAGGTAGISGMIFGVFTLARFVHSWAYLVGRQPWRTLAFLTGALATVALMLNIVWLLIGTGG